MNRFLPSLWLTSPWVLWLIFPWVLCLVLGLADAPGAEPGGPPMYQVSPQGADIFDADGQSRPWQSLGYALSRIPDAGGVEILVQPGSYPAFSSTRRFEQRVTLRAAVPHESILLPSPDQGPVLLTGACNLRLEGFVLDNQNNPAVSNALQILAGSSVIEVVNCRITHGGQGYGSADAVKIHQQVSRILLEENEIYDANDEEVELGDWVHDITLRRNVIYRRRSSSREAMVAIQERAWRIVLDRNVLVNTDPEARTPLLRLGTGLEKRDETSEILLLNNVFIHPATGPVIALTGCARALIENNLFYTRAGQDPVLRSWVPYPRLNRPSEISRVYLWSNRVVRSATEMEEAGVEPALRDNGSVIVLDAGENGDSGYSSAPDPAPADCNEIEKFLQEKPSLDWLNLLLPNPGLFEAGIQPFEDEPGFPESLRMFWEEYRKNG